MVLVNAFSKLDIMVSTTSACSSKGKLNEVLMSMGLPDNKIEGSIRLSLGDMTTQEDIDQFKVKFETIYKEIKELLK